ncbi:PfkB family carbohydrate kinase [Cryptosporangium phraense]|uniref:Sugar kinase n=1 Tax=Cryptosporangium phraense TaxID=2593070 RepID=A0A545AXB7_9ACTN|nr:PfkB family carbohydrate kinase [Cryptosporangium phraense]TQS45976.1 sugar kinase [Cryptosporangium phraense]
MPGATVYSLESILVDLAITVPALPERGGDVLATAARTNPGGGFNLASAVVRQGVRCVYAAPHGTGRYGDVIRAALAEEGVAWTIAPRPVGDSGYCVVLVEPGGERTFVTVAGVEAGLTTDDLSGVAPRAGDAVVVSGYDLAYPGSGPVLADWLPGLPDGVLIAFDPGPMVLEVPPDRLARTLTSVDLLTLNQREARMLTGAPSVVSSDELDVGLLDAVRRAGVADGAMIVLRAGRHGCAATGGSLGRRVLAVPAPVVRAVDTTGAGDVHTAVLLARLVTGVPVEDALVDAVRAGALAVQHAGSATGPTLAELRSYAEVEGHPDG